MKILIVEDEPALRELIQRSLEKERYVVEVAADFNSALRKIEDYDYDCVLLDIMLPDGSGLDLLEKLKAMHKRENVIIISAKDSLEDKVLGLELGADDYLGKPFEIIELLARVEGLLRHTGRRAATLQAFDAVIDPDNHIVTQNGTRVELTPREFDLLLALVRARGQLLYREALYERVWGLDSNAGPRTVDIHIHRLRKKLHWDHKIVTVPKVGYKLLP